MKLKQLIALSVILATLIPAHAADTWALLVGVSKYQSPQISSLRYPSIDATSIRDALIDPKLGNVPAAHVRLLVDDGATVANINDAVDNFLKPNVKAGDQVVIFLAGHGVAKGVGINAKSFLLPTDVKGLTTSALESSAVDLRSLSSRLGQLPAAQFVVFVDACREDPTPGRGIKGNQMSDVLSRSVQVTPQNENASSVTFYACGVGQRAFEDPELKHGVFTYWILDGIRQAPVPQKPDGAVDMRVLASYVSGKVKDWAKKTSASGDFEIDQTPECVMPEANGRSVVLMRVKRPLPATTVPVDPPKVVVATFPEGAQVTINGEKQGAGTVAATLPKEGTFNVKVESPGYAPIERSVKLLGGFEQTMTVHLQPAARGVAAPAGGQADEMYQRALGLEKEQQWEAAAAGYQAVRQADPKFAPAYERLAAIQTRQGDSKAAIGTLIELANQAPSAHALSLLSRAYSNFAAKNPPEKKGKKFKAPSGPPVWRVPESALDAAPQALLAANQAVQLEAGSGDAQSALGFALVATDQDGRNKQAALAAFGKALFADPKDAGNYYGSAYGKRFFAMIEKDKDVRDNDLQSAISALKKALELRPDYYEAHRELAYCYHLLDQTDPAIHEYEMANATRGQASDKDEVAGENVALSGLHKQAATKSGGNKKQQHEAASDGYLTDAKEITPNLKQALGILAMVGLGTNLTNFLPTELQRMVDWKGTIRSNIPDLPNIPGGGKIKLPF